MTADGLDGLLTSGRLPDPLAALAGDFVTRAGNTDDARESIRGTLETYLSHPEWTVEFERALASDDQFRAVSDTAAGLVADGADPDQVQSWLNGFHLALMSEQREQDDDVVLEVLDELTGF
jgi:hypothetical protein